MTRRVGKAVYPDEGGAKLEAGAWSLLSLLHLRDEENGRLDVVEQDLQTYGEGFRVSGRTTLLRRPRVAVAAGCARAHRGRACIVSRKMWCSRQRLLCLLTTRLSFAALWAWIPTSRINVTCFGITRNHAHKLGPGRRLVYVRLGAFPRANPGDDVKMVGLVGEKELASTGRCGLRRGTDFGGLRLPTAEDLVNPSVSQTDYWKQAHDARSIFNSAVETWTLHFGGRAPTSRHLVVETRCY